MKIGNGRFEIETVHCIDWKNNVQDLHLYDEEQLSQYKDVTEVLSSDCEETVPFSQNEVEGVLIGNAKLIDLENWKRNHGYD